MLAAWRKHPEWPNLVVVQSPRHARPGPPAENIDHRIGYIGDEALRGLQNRCRFHVCPSEVEGFGHYLVEALSVVPATAITYCDAAGQLGVVPPVPHSSAPESPVEIENV